MGIFIQRKRDGEEIVQVIPREAVVMVELLGERLVVRTVAACLGVEVRLKPEQVEGIKGLLLSFAEGKVIWLVEA